MEFESETRRRRVGACEASRRRDSPPTASRIHAILKARSSIVRSVGSLSWCAAAATKLSYPTIDLGACWTRHFERGRRAGGGGEVSFPVAIFSLYARISVSVTNTAAAAVAAERRRRSARTYLMARPEIIVPCNARTTSEPPYFPSAHHLRIRRARLDKSYR